MVHLDFGVGSFGYGLIMDFSYWLSGYLYCRIFGVIGSGREKIGRWRWDRDIWVKEKMEIWFLAFINIVGIYKLKFYI